MYSCVQDHDANDAAVETDGAAAIHGCSDDSSSTASDDSSSTSSDDSSDSDSEEAEVVDYYLRAQKRRRQMAIVASIVGMYHHEFHMNKAERRVPLESGYQWVTRTLDHRT